MEPVRVWRQERVDAGGVRYVRFVYSPYEGGSEWTTVDLPMAALPRAEYDALAAAAADARTLRAERDSLVKEREEKEMIATANAETWRKFARERDAALDAREARIEQERDEARRERVGVADAQATLAREAANHYRDRANAATARADAADERAKAAEALLREAVRYVTPRDTSGDGGHAADLAARIDALLGEADRAPTPDDRRGEDAPSSDEWRGVDADAIQAATGRARPTTETGQAAQTPP